MPTPSDRLRASLDVLDARQPRLGALRAAFTGESPSAFLSASSSTSLDGRLTRLGINFPRLVIRSQVDRLRVTGFRRAGDQDPDPGLWRLWRAAGLVDMSELVHVDRALYGSAAVFVWGHRTRPRTPVVTACSPWHAHVETDPGTGEVLHAVRRWETSDTSHAVLWEPDAIRRFRLDTRSSTVWNVVETTPNPWGVVPVVPFVRRASLDDQQGTSAVADILDLTDAAAKVLQDGLVTSEYYARPRRWATGLEIVEDDEGNPVDPFADGRFLQSEDPATKFGQLDPPKLDSYADLMSTIVQHVAALSGMPPHYVGLFGDQPSNVDSIRAAETQLTSAAYADMRHLDASWAAVAAMLHAVATDTHPHDVDAVPVWASPEVRTPAQAADAAAKLHGIGVPLASLLTDPLGMDPQRARSIVDQQRVESLTRAAENLGAAPPAKPERTGRGVFRG